MSTTKAVSTTAGTWNTLATSCQTVKLRVNQPVEFFVGASAPNNGSPPLIPADKGVVYPKNSFIDVTMPVNTGFFLKPLLEDVEVFVITDESQIG